jgi:hypothetical protein
VGGEISFCERDFVEERPFMAVWWRFIFDVAGFSPRKDIFLNKTRL